MLPCIFIQLLNDKQAWLSGIQYHVNSSHASFLNKEQEEGILLSSLSYHVCCTPIYNADGKKVKTL